MTSLEATSAAADEDGPGSKEITETTGTVKSLAGVKRNFSDIDIPEGNSQPTKKMNAAGSVGSDHATTRIFNPQQSSEERDNTVAGLRSSLSVANEELDRWKNAFVSQSILPLGTTPDPTVVIQAIQKLQASENQSQEQLLTARRREGVMLVKLSNMEHEILSLKNTVRRLKRLSKQSLPSMVRPLLPKPADYDEVSRLKNELEPAEKIVTELPDITVTVPSTRQKRNIKLPDSECSILAEEDLGPGCGASDGQEDNQLEVPGGPPPDFRKKVGRSRKYKEEDEGEEGKKNWMDSEVETLISLRWEMEPEFVKNAYKQGVDMWSQLQARMLSAIPGFTRSGLACQRKFNSLIKQHKKDILELKEGKHHTWDRHARKFYDNLDRWWHTNGTVMKHVTTSANTGDDTVGDMAHMIVNKEELTEGNFREDEGEEEGKKNWLDSEVETMVTLRWEMEPEFLENSHKPGEDMWSKLQVRMSSLIPGFTRSGLACQRKFNALIRQHKKDILEIKEFGSTHHYSKFYNVLDRWWHTDGTLVKQSTSSAHISGALVNPVYSTEISGDATKKVMVEDDEGEEGKKNWADSEVETLITLRREMEPEFVKNWKKQGGNMWSKLRSRMLSLYPGFSRSPLACKRKFNTLIRQYKKDLHAVDVTGDEHQSCKFYDIMDQWLHTNGTSLKHVTSASGADLTVRDPMYAIDDKQDGFEIEGAEGSTAGVVEKNTENGDMCGTFSKMVENSTSIVNDFAKSSALLEKMDAQMDRLIDNL